MIWADGKTRCVWANPRNPQYIAYHDHEWGVPLHDDHKLFEMLLLECFQAGLSWECVLNKRAAFRAAFADFDLDTVCAYDDAKIAAMMCDPSLIRNRLKLQAAVSNARVFRRIREEFGSFDAYLWRWSDNKVIYECGKSTSALSDAISRDLKTRGMRFVGSTTIYAYLQAVGVIYSHDAQCFLAHSSPPL